MLCTLLSVLLPPLNPAYRVHIWIYKVAFHFNIDKCIPEEQQYGS